MSASASSRPRPSWSIEARSSSDAARSASSPSWMRTLTRRCWALSCRSRWMRRRSRSRCVEGADTSLSEVALQACGPDEYPDHAAEPTARGAGPPARRVPAGRAQRGARRERSGCSAASPASRQSVPLRRASGVHRGALRAPSSCSRFASPSMSPCGSARPSRCRRPRRHQKRSLATARMLVITRIGNHPGDSSRAAGYSISPASRARMSASEREFTSSLR